MKKVLAVLLVLFTGFHSMGQRRDANYYFWPIYEPTQKINFSEFINLPEANADTLYNIAKEFAEANFKSGKDTILVRDSISKTIVCKGAYYIPIEELGERGQGYVSFTLFIECYHQYYKYSLSNLEHFPLYENGVTGGPLENEKTASGGMLFPRSYWEKQKGRCYSMIQTTIQHLKNAMNRAANT